ncbi:MAG: cytochrome-c peroxidase [Planctomycetia bacterium]|nr:cytochrome-c peroxidase [Planctomycetia bacterium]
MTASADKDATKASAEVFLGSPELTAGIPGEGPLKVDQVQAWLENSENHLPLEIVLPLGLAVGSSQVQGIADNLMTRAKIELGRQLYFDTRLSADNTVACASCHHPDEGYAKHTQFGVGINGQMGGRNSPVSYNRILSGAQFWDGRAASLEAQAVGPIQNPIEMGNTHEKAVETVKGIAGYEMQFKVIFGDEGVTIDNIGRAIATFERAIVTGPSPFDYYEAVRPFLAMKADDLESLKEDDAESYAKYQAAKAAAEAHAMSASAIRGRDLFFSERVACTACHVGANLADEKYHNLGVGFGEGIDKPDLGRFEVSKDEKDKGAFKTPTIRNVALSAPYMHDGGLKTLEEVVEHYNKGGNSNQWLSTKIKKLDLKPEEKADLVEFMKACTGEVPKVERERLPE